MESSWLLRLQPIYGYGEAVDVAFHLAGPAKFENGQMSIVLLAVGGKAMATVVGLEESGQVTVTAHSGQLVPGKVDLKVE